MLTAQETKKRREQRNVKKVRGRDTTREKERNSQMILRQEDGSKTGEKRGEERL